MTSDQSQLHIFFLPFMAPSHMIPAMDMAKIFAIHEIGSTIVTTPANKAFFAETIEVHNQKSDIKINILTMKFPSLEAGLPEGYENADSLRSTEFFPKFVKATDLLQHPFEELMASYNPTCLVADFFFPWANSAATKSGIPCITFHGSGYFSQCIMDGVLRHKPHEKLSLESDSFIVPGLPDEIKLTKSELSPSLKNEGPKFILQLMEKTRITRKASFGVIMNSFYELEPAYADYYKNVMGIKHWHIGPFPLYFDKEANGPNLRGKRSSIDISECIRWLDEKQNRSVIYICFGSMTNVSEDQLNELAIALEALDQNFILVVKQGTLEGYEARVKEKGLIIRGWAPQVLILNHKGTGGFVTHCGWNSILEGVNAGVPMVTWPQYAEQFYNEKLVTDVLKIGVQVGAKIYPGTGNEVTLIRKEEILRAMEKMIVGEEAQDMRMRAKELQKMARRAISEGGSSYSAMQALIGDLKSYKK